MSFSVIKLVKTIKDTSTVAIGCVSGQEERSKLLITILLSITFK